MSPTAKALLEELLGDPEGMRELRTALDAIAPASQPTGDDSGYLNPTAAASYLGVSRKRVHDLTSARAIVPDGRDGRTPLYLRSSLDNYARARR